MIGNAIPLALALLAIGWFVVGRHRRRSARVAECRAGRHESAVYERIGYRWPGEGFRSVADEIVQHRTACRYCADATSDWETIQSLSFQSLSMDPDRWRELKRRGFLQIGRVQRVEREAL